MSGVRRAAWPRNRLLLWCLGVALAGCGTSGSRAGVGGDGHDAGVGGAGAGAGGAGHGGAGGQGGSGVGGSGGGGAGGSGGGGPTACLPVQSDNMPASINPPAGLDPAKVPQFVMLGFDDNAHADGVDWVVDTLIGGKRNKDGSPARVTFFIIGGAATTDNGGVFNNAGGQSEADLTNAWAKAWAAGHDIGDHTWDHADGGDGRVLADWNNEINPSHAFIQNALELPQCAMIGWRFPFLHFDDAGFQAIDAIGYRFDASVEFGYDWWQPPGFSNGFGSSSPEYGKHFWWPFTLDNGFDASFSCCSKGVGRHPGVWEFPVHTFTRPDPMSPGNVKTVTGLDYNLWQSKATVDASIDFCATLKYSFDQRYNSNRSPFNVGCHSDIYSEFNPTVDQAFGNTADYRRAALQCFVDYVLTFPDARVVTFKSVIEWMRNPKAIH